MKKILAILALVAIFTACGTKSNEVETTKVDSLSVVVIDSVAVDSVIADTILIVK